jgi:Xaa-Pro aminopeptidase
MNTQIPAAVFTQRRQRLGKQFSSTLFVIPSGVEVMRSHSVAYRFKALSEFYYLTGLRAASGMFLVVAGERCHLLAPEVSSETRLWEGGSVLEGEPQTFESIAIGTTSELRGLIMDYSKDVDRMALPIGRSPELDALALELASYSRTRSSPRPLALVDSRTMIGTLRLHKDDFEISCMREAGQRSSRVHRALMSKSLNEQREIDIANWIEASFLLEGMDWRAYGTIVGTGDRTTILHARATERKIKKGDLVLIDAGGEWQGYCADITRTLPASGRFSVEQRAIYEVVLAAQRAAIAKVRPGISLEDIHISAREGLTDGLQHLGYSDSEVRAKISSLQPHGTSHWLGLDVHDPAPFHDDSGQSLRLEPGMCLTIEPGLYFKEPGSRFTGIGVRIEDDVLVTYSGYELLSSVPKEIDEIENLCAHLFDTVIS